MTRTLDLFDDLVGAPWLEHGRDPATGLDCLGIVIVGLQRLGIPAQDPMAHLQDRLRWERQGDRSTDAYWPEGWHAVWPVHPLRLLPGDIAAIDSGGGAGGHLALWIGEGWWLHADKRHGVYKTTHDVLRARIMKVRRWRSAA